MGNNLEHLIAGDQLAIPSAGSFFGGIPHIAYRMVTIERVTATQIICTNGTRARRTDGLLLGDPRTGSHTYAIHASERILAENAEQKAAQDAYLALSRRAARLTDALNGRKVSREALAALTETFERFYPIEPDQQAK